MTDLACFECGHDLHAPFCPVCNPEMVARRSPDASGGGEVTTDMVLVPRELVLFLLGEGEWKGRDFGDAALVFGGKRVGRYWWRTDLRAALSAAPPASVGWQDIGTIPEKTRVLVWVTGRQLSGVRFGSAYRLSDGRLFAKPEGVNGDWSKDVTHWMPLPPPPPEGER